MSFVASCLGLLSLSLVLVYTLFTPTAHRARHRNRSDGLRGTTDLVRRHLVDCAGVGYIYSFSRALIRLAAYRSARALIRLAAVV